MGKMSDLDLQIKELRSCGETILEIAETLAGKMCIRDRCAHCSGRGSALPRQ